MRYAILLAVLLASGTLTAQTFRASVLAGANLSQIDGDDLLGFHQPGVNAGLRVVAVLNDHWRLGPEIVYTQEGAKRNRNSLNISDFRRIQLNAVELPLMVYYKDWRFTAEAGVAYQRLVDYRIEDAGGVDVTPDYNLTSDLFALKLGVTVFITPNVGVNFRWSRHLTDLRDADDVRWLGRTLTLRAVYTFGVGETLPVAGQPSPASSPN